MTPPDDDKTLRSFSAIAPREAPAANAGTPLHLGHFPLPEYSARFTQPKGGNQGEERKHPRRSLKDVAELHGLALDGLAPDALAVLQEMEQELGRAYEALAAAEGRIALLEQERDSDGLTQLLNRRAFLGEIERLKQFDRREEHRSTLILLELPGIERERADMPPAVFERIMARLGTLLGDAAGAMPAARLGGARFAVLAVAMAGDQADAEAGRLATALSQPVALPGETRRYHPRIGLAVIHPDHEAEELIAQAEADLRQ